ncbi:hypothetical protein C7Y66_25515 [Chroococcidiopsis sp. CCALA 051]|uniref:hypothetical protein n=1 Tax=Chroococcidiopsis sp. CCALA 051 TaxID=869949 RepID=UPI000D0D4E94|nr:hypothetical protein [Chroococcidiopsis sp. CCALA 051]PSM46346.1 hypothetical protein C7Y66_25515 [Chroococcidiopsis sp. CCALA 051]
MAKDYVLFLHGVNVRESEENEKTKNYTYANSLFKLITEIVQQKSPTRNCIKVPLYWGNVNRAALNELLVSLQGSSKWNQLWFQDFRKSQLLQFVGDAGLYISRLIGSMAADQLKEQAFKGLEEYEPEDRLHLVTHSWGTVILFDILFASRWDNQGIPGYSSVKAIRDRLYGIGENPTQGIRLASIQTMGSPIALFSLITISGRNANDESTFDISPGLENLLKNLVQGDKKLPWLNFIHPGDPIAWSLEKVINKLITGSERYVQVEDILTRGSGFWELIAQTPPIRQTFLALANGGSAHGSYWHNRELAQRIATNILTV